VQMSISARHGHLSEEIQEKIRSKVARLPRYFERLTAIEVTIDLEHEGNPSADIRVSAEHKHDCVSKGSATGVMPAVDAAVHKLEQQLRKYKERLQSRNRHGGKQLQQPPLEVSPESGEPNA